MRQRWGSAQSFIDTLTQKERYEFTLKGEIEDEIGTTGDIEFFDEKDLSKRNKLQQISAHVRNTFPKKKDDVEHIHLEPQRGDPPHRHPPPPKVEIKIRKTNTTQGKSKISQKILHFLLRMTKPQANKTVCN